MRLSRLARRTVGTIIQSAIGPKPGGRSWFASALLALAVLAGGCAAKPPAAPKTAAFWPPYPDEPRIQFLVSFEKNEDVEPPKSKLDELVLGKEVQQVLALNKPYGLEMWQGKIYVCDLRARAVIVLDLRNRRTLILGRSGADTLERPTDIAIADDGVKYVADQDKGMVYVFDAQDRLIGKFGHKDLKPVGVAVYQNELYVADFRGQRIEVLDRRTGQLLRTVGEPGTRDGQFVRPLGVAVDKDGCLYVTDVLNCRLQKFDRQGNVVTAFGTISANAGGLVRPKHVAVDSEGIIYVADAAFQNVQLFDQQGRVYTFFGSAGGHPGSMNLPAGVAVHEADLDLFSAYIHPAFEAQRLILVTNQFGPNKVSVYALGRLKPGKTVADIAASKDIVPLSAGVATDGKISPIPAPATQPAPEEDVGAASPSPAATRPADTNSPQTR
ncbi:hypothetical protein [Fontivita pretiosa]|uniref:hypothetical protein n=1 Tax=Fontivita pretiosa TaxID=2989684 RepID=UPI003D165126